MTPAEEDAVEALMVLPANSHLAAIWVNAKAANDSVLRRVARQQMVIHLTTISPDGNLDHRVTLNGLLTDWGSIGVGRPGRPPRADGVDPRRAFEAAQDPTVRRDAAAARKRKSRSTTKNDTRW